MFGKRAFLEAGGYRPEERHAEDFSLWGRMIELGDFVGLPEKLFILRLHSQSVSKQYPETQMALTKKIAIEHCQRFMRLSNAEAQGAQAILTTPPRERHWSDWWWFLGRLSLPAFSASQIQQAPFRRLDPCCSNGKWPCTRRNQLNLDIISPSL